MVIASRPPIFVFSSLTSFQSGARAAMDRLTVCAIGPRSSTAFLSAPLVTLMIGPDAWNCFTGHAGAWYGQLFLFGWTWAFAYHLCNGIRHIVQDFAIGYRIATFVRNSWLSVIGSLVITALVWGYVLLGGGA